MQAVRILAAFLVVAAVCNADDLKSRLEELDRLWAEEHTETEWRDMYLKEVGTRGVFGEELDNKCPITIMMSGTDPGLDCLIEHELAEGMGPTVYGVDMEVSIGGINDAKGLAEGKRDYSDLAPRHGSEKKQTAHGVPNVYSRPPVKELWPDRYPEKVFDRVRYVMEIDKTTIARLLRHKLFFYKGTNDGVPWKQSYIMAKLMGPYFLKSRVSEAQQGYFRLFHKQGGRWGEGLLENGIPTKRKDAYVVLKEYWRRRDGANFCPCSGSQPLLNNIIATEGEGKVKRFDPEVAWSSTQVFCAMHNGLTRSLGILWTAYFATESTSKWGPGKRPVVAETPYEGLFRLTYWHGDRPLNLMERQLYTYWLEGLDLILISDGAYLIFKKGPDDNTFLPSDFGLKIKRLNDLAMGKTGFDRGDVYRPAGIMLDRYTNWIEPSPPDAHTWDPPGPYRRRIMDVEDYKKRDYMIDNFFGAIFPGYEWSASWGTPKGDVVNGPYGDSFEVIYDSVDPEVLAYYPSCFVLGEPEMTDEVKKKLMDYVKNGGDLVLNIMQVDEELLAFCGVKADWHVNRWYKQLGELRVADASKNLVTDQVYVEDRYHYNRVFPEKGTEILAETAGNPEFAGDLDAGWPLVMKKKQGKGNVYLVTAQYMQNSSCLNFPYGLLNVCRDLIGMVLDPHQVVKIDGPPVQYIVNRQKDGGLVVTLINNGRTEWSGKAIVRNAAKLKKVKEWYEDKVPEIGADGKDAVIETVLKPGDIRIYSFD